MIGILFHGPEVFDSGWANSLVRTIGSIGSIRCVLAGTMGRTAAVDSGLGGIEFPGKQPSVILKELQHDADCIVFANFGKSAHSGVLLGSIVVERSGIDIPLLQVECAGHCYVEWIEGTSPLIIAAIEKLGFRSRDRFSSSPSTWEKDGRMYRRLTTAVAGEFLLVNGIIIGRASGEEIVLECSGRQITRVEGVDIKQHGLEKLMRLGGIDLKTAKIASTSSLRRSVSAPGKTRIPGKGMAFVDHAGMHIYDLVRNMEGVVTVGDDTTAVVGDILYRFQKPLIGITDGDKDSLLADAHFTSGSTVFTVQEDDRTGLQIYSDVFLCRPLTEDSFGVVRKRISMLIGADLIVRKDY